MSRITELINLGENISYSFEVTSNIKLHELDNLEFEPLFYSIPWHVQAHEFNNLDTEPVKLAKHLRSRNKNVLLHISCTNMKKDYLDKLLVTLQNEGICNLFLILGEKFNPSTSDFEHSQDLLVHIRKRTGNYFCIGVAGYPERVENISQLKEKVNCGVDFILTQAIFEFNTFKHFLDNCQEAGILVPIFPGIFPFETEIELNSFVLLCKVRVTEDFLKNLSEQSGVEILTKLANELIQQLKIKHLHFFTFNNMGRSSNLIRKLCS